MAEKIVLLGAAGMLGADVQKLIGTENLACFDLPDLDITNPAQLKKAVFDADIVINCAAFTDVEKAESKKETAFAVNAEAVSNLAKIAKQKNIYVIHISTDFVFDGQKKTSYTETDKANPINIYGQSKLDGEKLLAESHDFYSIIRVQWTYGTGGNNFIKKIITLSQKLDSLKVVDDQTGTPTATKQIAAVIKDFITKKPQGLFHYAAKGVASRYETAKFIFDNLNIKTKIAPCKSSEFKTAAQRPLNSRFCCDKIQNIISEPIEAWQKPLEEFLKNL